MKYSHCRIVQQQKNYFVVDTPLGEVQAVPRGVLKKQPLPVVGDMVDVEVVNIDTRECVIEAVHPRRNLLARPPLANMDLMVLVATVSQPDIDLETMDRLLFCAEYHSLQVLIVFNKADILTEDLRGKLADCARLYERVGYEVLVTSAVTRDNLDQLTNACRDKFCFFAGASGVGKSSLLSAIMPGQSLRSAPLSARSGRGVHTTTATVLLKLEGGGYIADTPGFSLVELPPVAKESVAICFPEIARNLGSCRFKDCAHNDEPGCAIRDLVAKGEIAASRHAHYRAFYQNRKEMQSRFPGADRLARG